ncbi:hypothetical protein DITRI_Ditri08aG0116500 [Diplodiscus trichospermus]
MEDYKVRENQRKNGLLNEFYESVEDGVEVNSERERFSVPTFSLSHYVMVMKPLDKPVNEKKPAKFKEHNFGKSFVSRNRSD